MCCNLNHRHFEWTAQYILRFTNSYDSVGRVTNVPKTPLHSTRLAPRNGLIQVLIHDFWMEKNTHSSWGDSQRWWTPLGVKSWLRHEAKSLAVPEAIKWLGAAETMWHLCVYERWWLYDGSIWIRICCKTKGNLVFLRDLKLPWCFILKQYNGTRWEQTCQS